MMSASLNLSATAQIFWVFAPKLPLLRTLAYYLAELN